MILAYSNFVIKSNLDIPYSQNFLPAVKSGIIQGNELAEASGLIASRINIGYFWTINDSGNAPKLYLIDDKGATIHTYWIGGCTNIDWEDLTIYTDKSTGKSTVYIGDIGDNYAVRDHINVIVFEEPSIQSFKDTLITTYATYKFRYEDGARDAETILIDPITQDLLILSKREKNIRIYKTPTQLNEMDTMTLSVTASLPFNNITSGDISIDGTEILLKNYNAVFYWNRDLQESISEALVKDHELVRYQPEPQGESISWAVDRKGFYTLSEKSWAKEQVIFYFEKSKN